MDLHLQNLHMFEILQVRIFLQYLIWWEPMIIDLWHAIPIHLKLFKCKSNLQVPISLECWIDKQILHTSFLPHFITFKHEFTNYSTPVITIIRPTLVHPTAWSHYRNSNPFIIYSCDISFQPPFQPSLRTQVLIMFPWICSSNNIISPNLHKCVTNLVV